MSDDFNDEHMEDEQESFAELLESYSAGMNDDLQVGDKISARIISIGKDAVFLDTGTKVDGVVDRAELFDEEGNLSLSEGDTVELYVVAMDEHEIRLSRAISGIGGLELLTDAFRNAIPVEGKVSAVCKGGLNVEILQRRAFCPISQIDVDYVETPDDYVGQTFEFQITQLEERGKNIVVSRRKLLAEAREKEQAAFLSTLKAGDPVRRPDHPADAVRGLCRTDTGTRRDGAHIRIELVPAGKTRRCGPPRRHDYGPDTRYRRRRQKEPEKNRPCP